MMWKFPWKYRESFIIVLGLLISGLILQLTTHFYIPSVSFPVNLIFAFALLFFCIWLFRNRRNHPLVEWLSSIQAAISAIIFMSVECLCMGLIPQTQDGPPIILLLGLHHLTGSWPFVFAEIYFLLILGLITLTRAFPFKFSNLGFLWFHAGLWITMVAMLLGNGDIQKVMVSLTQHTIQRQGTSQMGQVLKLPFKIKLNYFRMDEYQPTLVLLNNKTAAMSVDKAYFPQRFLEQGKTFLLGNWNCVVLRYLPDAVLVNTNFVTYQDTGSVPAALISAANSSGAKVQGWITCGNYLNPQRILQLDSVVSLAMTDPMPRKLSSDVIIYAEHNRIFHATISVNKPCKIDGWYIYQSGYDTNMGKWSRISELELVSDPWLGVVYTGMILLLIGTIFLVVHGRNSTLVKQRRL